MTTCPQCGRATAEGPFCERCGAELASPLPRGSEVVRPEETHVGRSVFGEEMLAKQRGEPTLEIDRLCPLFENMNGTLRFRFNPKGGGDPVDDVVITFSNCDCAAKPVQRIRRARQVQEFPVQFPPQHVGMQSWHVTVEYVSSRRRHELTGDFQVVVRPVESRKRGSDSFNIKFETNIGNVSQASDVVVNQRGAEGLANLIAATDPFEEMSRVFLSDKRQWVLIPFSDDNKVVDLPPMPARAQTDHIAVALGGKRLHFFSNRAIRFGRNREANDISLRPAGYGVEFGRDDPRCTPYERVSRVHCLFEHSGTNVLLTDGNRNALGVTQPSSHGTFWNDERLQEPVELPPGTSGIVSFCGIHYGDNVSMDLRVCEPAKACATCPHANIHWCGEGKRPSLMLSRRDGIPEKFIGLWSCFWLGEADPSFEGVVIFRKDGAFAYRCDDGRSGWLVPDTVVQTDFGPATVN